MKKLLLLLLIFNCQLSIVNCSAQTNVSGGIYANTTWTLANSPYIVVDTVVVFPGVTLTIEPGVVVKFADNKRLEIRNAKLIAIGTSTDSIIFTSNSITPNPGIWNSVNTYGGPYISTFSYCSFYYASMGIDDDGNGNIINHSNFVNNVAGITSLIGGGNLIIDSCNFFNNTYGLDGVDFPTLDNCVIRNNSTGLHYVSGPIIKNCFINNNQTGMSLWSQSVIKDCVIDSNIITGIYLFESVDSVINCEIKYNGIGINSAGYPGNVLIRNFIESNTTGIQLGNYATIYCNKICNNSSYDIRLTTPTDLNAANNYWCTTDSISTEAVIYDGYDDLNLGLVYFMPLDTLNCYLTGCNLHLTPHVTNATCDTCHNGSASINVTNGFAPYSYSWFTSPIQTTQTATGLASGTYTVCITDGHGCTACDYNVYVDSTNCTGFAVNATATNASCTSCSDGTGIAHITAGTPPFSYIWYSSPIQTTDTATGLPTGSYAVCVNDLYGCIACDTVTVSIGSCSAYYIIYADTVPHTYDLVNMASGTPPLTYDWNWGDGSPHDTAAYPSHTYAGSGNYTICLSITDSAGCSTSYCHSFFLLMPNSSVFVHVIPPVSNGIHVNTGEKLFSISPNPASDYLTLHFAGNTSQSQIRIINLLGETKYSSSASGTETNLNISSLSGGIYFVEVSSGSKISREKFVKQ